jgi:PRTRC genetic system protein C
MQIDTLIREFRYNGARLADPSPDFSLQQVRDLYGNTYPEIVNAEIEGPEVIGNRNVFTFRRAVGTKGNGITLAELRDALERGTLAGTDAVVIHESAVTSEGRQLHALATSRDSGPRIMLPRDAMPVLP